MTPQTITRQAPLSMGFSRQEYWSRLPFPSPRDLPDPEREPRSSALQADSLPAEPQGKIVALGDRGHVWTYFKTMSAVSGWRMGLEAESFPCRHQHGEFVPNPVLVAQKPEPDAEEAALGAHAVGRAGIRPGGGVFLPLHWRNHL